MGDKIGGNSPFSEENKTRLGSESECCLTLCELRRGAADSVCLSKSAIHSRNLQFSLAIHSRAVYRPENRKLHVY